MKRPIPAALIAITCIISLAGCTQKKVAEAPILRPAPSYSRPLAPGQSALRLVTSPARMPNLGEAYRNRDGLLTNSIDESLTWFAAPSSKGFYPFQGFTHEQVRTSLVAMMDLLKRSSSETAFATDVRRMFDVYESVGCDDRGTVLFTGYYAPVFNASRTRSAQFTHPLYKRPEDLVTDPRTGEPRGRAAGDGSVAPYATRRQIEQSGMLAGTELVWLEDSLSAYLIHVNGSAKLRMADGSVLYIGYAGKTDRPYASLGKAMIADGLLSADEVSLPAIRRVYRLQPHRVDELMYRNENYVFFTEYAGDSWPSGSLGVKVTAEASLATDKKIYPRGAIVFVDTQAVTFSEGTRRFQRFMLDQDTGGAIRAPGRADIFMGVGPGAEILAGGQHAEGRLYYFFLKPQYIAQYATNEEATAAARTGEGGF